MKHSTRESWLIEAADHIALLFAQTKEDGEPVNVPGVRVSCGFPAGNVRKVIGQCWSTESAEDGVSQVFISPRLAEPIEVLATLIHELVHAVIDDVKVGHKGRFRKLAIQMGLEGKMTATHASEALVEILKPIIDSLGPYPHSALNLTLAPVKKQATRMLKASCKLILSSEDLVELAQNPDLNPEAYEALANRQGETCGYQVRTTQKWLDYGTPECPIHREPLEQEEKE